MKTQKSKLPRTKAVLDANVESMEVFVLRRLRWTVDTLKSQGVCATRSDIMRNAGIGTIALRLPSVQRAIAAAVIDLKLIPEAPPCNLLEAA
ncbi:MAG: hypothetical protein ACLQAH_00635 [Limisphaerales bacterium]